MLILYFTGSVIFCIPRPCLRNIGREELLFKFSEENVCFGGLPVEYALLGQIVNIAIIIIMTVSS